MSRNRRSQSAAVRFGPALKAFLLCLLIGGSGVGYVWQKEQIAKLGQRRKILEAQFTALETQKEILRGKLGKMGTPVFLELQIKKSGLGLAKPQDAQILRLPEPVATPARVEHNAQYAARSESPALGQ